MKVTVEGMFYFGTGKVNLLATICIFIGRKIMRRAGAALRNGGIAATSV